MDGRIRERTRVRKNILHRQRRRTVAVAAAATATACALSSPGDVRGVDQRARKSKKPFVADDGQRTSCVCACLCVCFFLLQLLDVLKKDRTLRAVHSKPSRCLFARRRVRCSRAKAKGESQRVQKICTVDISLQIVQCARAGGDGGGGTET